MVQPGDTIKIMDGNWFEDVKTKVRTSRARALVEARQGEFYVWSSVFQSYERDAATAALCRYTFRALDLVCNANIEGSGGVFHT